MVEGSSPSPCNSQKSDSAAINSEAIPSEGWGSVWRCEESVPEDATAMARFLETMEAVRVAHVHKRRVSDEVHGCLSETTWIGFNGGVFETRVLESGKIEALASVIRTLGWDQYPNLNYQTWLNQQPMSLPHRPSA